MKTNGKVLATNFAHRKKNSTDVTNAAPSWHLHMVLPGGRFEQHYSRVIKPNHCDENVDLDIKPVRPQTCKQSNWKHWHQPKGPFSSSRWKMLPKRSVLRCLVLAPGLCPISKVGGATVTISQIMFSLRWSLSMGEYLMDNSWMILLKAHHG